MKPLAPHRSFLSFVSSWPLTVIICVLAQPVAVSGAEDKSAIYRPATAKTPTTAIRLGPGPHLFLDEFLIESSSNVTRRINMPNREPAIPNPLVTGKEDGCFQPYLTVLRDPQSSRFRLWYGVHTADFNTSRSRLGYLESEDGIQWIRPHRVLLDPAPIQFGVSVLDEGSDCPNPAQRFKYGWYYGGGLRVAASSDGLSWKALSPEIVLAHNHDINSLFWDPLRKTYVATVSCYVTGPAWSGRRRVTQQSTSTDLLHWREPWFVLTPDDRFDEGETQFYAMDGYLRRGGLLIGMVKILRDDLKADSPPEPPEAYGIGYTTLAWSRDGEHWVRDRETFFDRSPEKGAWDHAHAWIDEQVPVGNEVYLYYGGYQRGHKVNRFEERQIGLVRMKRDRYVARAAGASGGSLTTPLLVLNADTMTLNADAQEGEVRVQVLAADGLPVPGFTKTDCEAIRGDVLAAPVRWRQPVSVLTGRPVRLEFFLKNARLFAFELQKPRSDNSVNVPLWGRFETAVTNARGYTNPFTDVTLHATFIRPDRSRVAFFGFHDGDGKGGQAGDVWKLRFMPDRIGTWSYECSFSDGAPGPTGEFQCVPQGAKPGPLRTDPANGHYWVFADGTHFWPRAYTAPEVFVAGNEHHWRHWIDYFFGGKHRFNFCNANLLNFVGIEEHLNWQGTPYQAPDPAQQGQFVKITGNALFPFLYSGSRPRLDGGSNVDWLRPSILCWANLDKVLGELEARQTVWFNHWGMIGWDWSGNGRLLVPLAARKAVLRYWIARLAPYWNVTWNIAGEWDELMKLAEVDELGAFVKQADPWKHPLTSHALGTTVDRPWVDFRVQQFAAGTSGDALANARRVAADYVNKPVFAFETSWEATPGKLTPDQVRTGAWGSVMGGAFYLYAECFEPTLTWGDGDAFRFVEIMHDFFSGLPYWRLAPDPALVSSGSLCLTERGEEYILFRQSGGTMILDLSDVPLTHVFKAEWLNPRTGEKKAAGSVTGGAKRMFVSPDAHDWVLHLDREGAPIK